jgi:hypothetical protein
LRLLRSYQPYCGRQKGSHTTLRPPGSHARFHTSYSPVWRVGGGKTTTVRTTVVKTRRRHRLSNPKPDADNLSLWYYSQQCNIYHSSTPALIGADEICDDVSALALGPFGAKPNCGLWLNERCALFIRGIKITSNWKERLMQQLLDGYLQDYLMGKGQWTMYSFQNLCWKRHETAFKPISKARQTQTTKMSHNLRYIGTRHAQ